MNLAWSEAAERNKEPILAVLRQVLSPRPLRVLEIGSGTGQHAVFFGEQMPTLDWQTSDRLDRLADIVARIRASRVRNVRLPREIDVTDFPIDRSYDVVYTANTAHIMSFREVESMFAGVAEVLEPHGKLVLYGPVNRDGEFTSQSNRQFDFRLRSTAMHMGLRDDRELDRLAATGGMSRTGDFDMPSNNRILVWQID